MPVVNIREAKTRLSKLIERALNGEEIIIEKAGKPVAKIVPFRVSDVPGQPGLWKGQVWISEDFDDLPASVSQAFSGEKS